MGQQFHKVLVRLAHQRNAVGKKQHILHPPVARQHIHERNRHPRLSCSCRHHQQTSAMLRVEVLAHALDGHLLVVAVGDAVLHAKVGDVVPLSFLYEQFQVALGVESIEPTGRIAQTVDYIGLKAIGIVNDRSHPISLFEAVGIEFGLVLALDG